MKKMRRLPYKLVYIMVIMLLIILLNAPFKSLKSFADVETDWTEIPIENGNFEKSVQSDTDLPSWNYWASGVKEGITISEDFSYEGSQSLEIHNDNVVGLESEKVDVQAGNHYKLTAQLYIEELTSGNPGIWLRWYDKDGAHLDNDATYFEDMPIGEWQEVEISADAPENAEQVEVFIYQTSTTLMKGFYDDLRLYEKVSDELDLDFEFGEATNLGPATLAAQTQGAAVGDDELYFATNGSPATFYAVDADTNETIFSESLPGSDVVWALTVVADGNVYFAGTQDGILYRYIVEEKTLEQVGKNPSDNWVWDLKSTDDGKVYGITYPNAKAFEYDIENDEFTDLGRFHETEQYARGLGVTEDNLYVGIGTGSAHLIQMNRETKEKTEIELPITGTENSVSNVWEYNNQIFVAYGTSLLIIDTDTHEVLSQMTWEDAQTFDGQISAPSPYDENIIYFRDKNTSELSTYDTDTHNIEAVEPQIMLPPSSTKTFEWTTDEDGVDVLSIVHNQLEYAVYNPIDDTLDVTYPDVEMQGLDIQSLEIGEDDNIYAGGYQGSFGIYDINKEDYILHERDPHQIEGIGFLNGKVYLGTYGLARIYEFDPDQAFEYTDGGESDNPEMVYGVPNKQDRPFTFTSEDDKLFIGTVPGYGLLGGSLTIYDSLTDEWESIHQIIENQSIVGLAYQNNIVYGGSSIEGGLGIDPSEEEAKMFAYDLTSGEHDTFDLNVDGLATPKMIGELSMGPDDLLWGVAWGHDDNGKDNTVVFAMDPIDKEIIKSTELYHGNHRGSGWRPFYLRWDEKGLLYTTAGRQLTVINPDSMQSKQVISDPVNLMDLDSDGNVYYASGADILKLSVPMGDATISVDSSEVMLGSETEIHLEATLANGKKLSLEDIDIEWMSSDPDIADVQDGVIKSKDVGITSIQAVVTYKGVETTSNEIELSITELNIENIETFDDLEVAYGTGQSDIDFPEQAEATLNDESTLSIPLNWDESDPIFNGQTPDTYIFEANMDLPTGITNNNNITITMTVHVLDKESEPDVLAIVDIETLPDIQVEFNTHLKDINFPSDIEVTLSDETTITVPVTWDGSNPVYNEKTPGTYTFTGTLDPSSLENVSNIEAHIPTVKVTVEEEQVATTPTKDEGDNDTDKDETDKETGPKGADGENGKDESGGELPKTATNMMNIIIAGILSITVGTCIIIFRRKTT